MNTKSIKPIYQMEKLELDLYTNQVRGSFLEVCAKFIESSHREPSHFVRVNGNKVAAWHIGYAGCDDQDGPYGWPMSLDALGNLYKGPIRRSVTKFTLGQMERAIKVLQDKL